MITITKEEFNHISSSPEHPLYKRAVMMHDRGITKCYIKVELCSKDIEKAFKLQERRRLKEELRNF